MSNNHSHYSNLIDLKEIDFCMSNGRVSKKLVEKMIERKNRESEYAQETLTRARLIIDELCSEYACKIDFWKTNYGQKILELKQILGNNAE